MTHERLTSLFKIGIVGRVADPHHFSADPNPYRILLFPADPDPDPAPCQTDGNLHPLVYRPSRAPF